MLEWLIADVSVPRWLIAVLAWGALLMLLKSLMIAFGR
jgi:hypothetical protein